MGHMAHLARIVRVFAQFYQARWFARNGARTQLLAYPLCFLPNQRRPRMSSKNSMTNLGLCLA